MSIRDMIICALLGCSSLFVHLLSNCYYLCYLYSC